MNDRGAAAVLAATSPHKVRHQESDNSNITSGATRRQALSPNRRDSRVYLLRLQSGADDTRRLRALLKVLLRRFGMRCLSITEEAC